MISRAVGARPLSGITVLDFTQWAGGPYCTSMLADMGAEVLKVEPPDGDPQRRAGAHFAGGQSAMFIVYNRGKKSVAIDLKTEAGRGIVHRIARAADVAVENFRPGTAERLGIGYETLGGLNPRLVYCSISGFGRTGAWRDRPGMDPVVQGVGGAMSTTGEPGGPPLLIGVPVADITSGMLATQGILLALLHRERTGEGQRVDVSMLDAVLYLLSSKTAPFFAAGEVTPRMGGAHPVFVPYQVFATRDGHITVGVQDDRRWSQFCLAIGEPDLARDNRFATNAGRLKHREELTARLNAIFSQRSSEEWLAVLEGHDVLSGPVFDVGQILTHPIAEANEMVVEIHHPQSGPFRVLGVPIKLSRSPGAVAGPAPLLGEHTRDVLAAWGYAGAEIDALLREGIVHTPPPMR